MNRVPMLLTLGLLAPASGVLEGAWAGSRQDTETEGQAFQIYDTQAARARVESAEEHIAAERWSEALVDLQGLLEEHWGEVLGAERPPSGLSGQESLVDVHEGAGVWARRNLLELPEKARELYQERYGQHASRALDAALSSGDRAGLTSVAMRWPATREAQRAWWALGDLELELGNADAALAAWKRGLRSELRVDELDLSAPEAWRTALERLDAGAAGARARADFAARLIEGEVEGITPDPPPTTSSALAPGGASPRLGRQVDRWAQNHVLVGSGGVPDGEHPFGDRTSARFSLFPAHYGDLVFYSTSRALFATESFTGQIAWRSDPGLVRWDGSNWQDRADPGSNAARFEDVAKFDKAIEYEESLIRPAASQGVVVAALQMPVNYEDEDSYGDLEIIRVVPERRLFAFDTESGQPLWDTRPPENWDGESGSFAERMTIVGSPQISGSRVIVPAARVRGRIEFFVGCFDLHTGEVLWNTPLITGQRPLNMFGRLVKEYAAPPASVRGERVVVATQLGTVACLDLFTGETLWQSTYDQIPIIAGDFYNPGTQQSVWRNSSPVLTEELALVAPHDGYDLLAYDLKTGAARWKIGQGTLNRRLGDRTSRIDLVLAADDRTVYFAGNKLAAFSTGRGIDKEAPDQRTWVYPATERLRERHPRPVVTRDRIYVSRRDGLHVLDRRNGKLIELVEGTGWGNPLISEGMLFTFSVYSLNGYFEWNSMLRRARKAVADAPGDPAPVEALARVLYNRGVSATLRSDYREAARWYTDAREAIEQFEAGDALDAGTGSLPALRACLFDVLRAEGRNARLEADPRLALETLRRAEGLAPDPLSRLELLLEEAEVLRERDPAGWLETLARIYDELADYPIAVLAIDRGNGENRPRFQPRVSLLGEAPKAAAELELPTGLWVLLQRLEFTPPGRAVDHAREFADLHALLHRYPGVGLIDTTAGEWASERLAAKLATGERRGYQPYADRALELLDLALEAGDPELLKRVGERFPHSPAALAANEARFDLFLASGQLAAASRVALGELPPGFDPRNRDNETRTQATRLARLAAAFGAQGNPELARAAVHALAQSWPDITVEVEGEGELSLTGMVDLWSASAELVPPPEPAFDSVIEEAVGLGSALPFYALGPAPEFAGEAGEEDPIRIYSDGRTLHAFSATSEGGPLWRRDFADPRLVDGSERESLLRNLAETTTVSGGRVHLATTASLITLASRDGAELWRHSLGSTPVTGVASSDGIILVNQTFDQGPGGVPAYRITALDAALGVPLWNLTAPSTEYRRNLIAGEGKLVVLPNRSGTARVMDLFTGFEVATFELELCLTRTAAAAWIDDGQIILPSFSRTRFSSLDANSVSAFDLETGERKWTTSFDSVAGNSWDLSEIFTFGSETLLLLEPAGGDTRLDPGLFSLNTQLGALTTRPVASVPDGRILGAGMTRRTALASPYVFALERPRREGGSFVVRAIHLTFGERWRADIAKGARSLNAYDMPMPAVSGDTVAVSYVVPDESARWGRSPKLVLLDRANGRQRMLLDLPQELFSTAAPIWLEGLGEGMLVGGARLLQWMK